MFSRKISHLPFILVLSLIVASPALAQVTTATFYGIVNDPSGARKNFAITEQIGFQLRADMFNAFNHTNLSNPSTDIDDTANFGKIFGTGGARTIQLNARFSF